MIGPKRTLHRVMWFFIALILPVLLLLTMKAQHPGPGTSGETLPSGVFVEGERLQTGSLLEGKLQASLLKESESLILELTQLETLKRPDLLVYLDQKDSSILLGEVGGTPRRQYPLPAGTEVATASFRLYSLAHHETLDSLSFTEVTP